MATGNYKLMSTKNYDLFSYDKENRPLELDKRSKLRRSLRIHGFIAAYPLHVVVKRSRLFIRDGQHRLAIARELGISVFYVICDDAADIAELNDTQQKWKINEYAGRYAAAGNQNYVEVIEFSARHAIPISTSMAILGDNAQERNLMEKFKRGDFLVRSRDRAERIAKLYTQLGSINRIVRTRFLLGALFAACLVADLDDDQLVRGAKRAPELLMKFGTRDGCLDMLERVYNFGRKTKFPLKISAENALRQRNPVSKHDAAAITN